MSENRSSGEPSGGLLALTAALGRAETVETAVDRAMELAETAFDRPVASVCECDPAAGTTTTLGSTAPRSSPATAAPDQVPDPVVRRLRNHEGDRPGGGSPDATVDTAPRGSLHAEAVVPVGCTRVLRLGVADPAGLDETAVSVVEALAANLEAALARIDRRRSASVDCDVARALFDGADEATFVSDADGGLVAANGAAVELTGHDRTALLTTALPDIGGETAPVTAHLDRAASGAAAPLTTTLRRPDGTDVTVEFASRRVDADGSTYVCTTARTPTEQPGEEADRRRPAGQTEDDVAAMRRLNELTAAPGAFDETVERLLSLGCDHFGLETGILSRIDGDDYEVEAVVDATDTHEAGAVYDLGQTMCEATLAGEATETLAFADVEDTDYRDHPAAESVGAYVAAPVVVDGETHGTVNFSRRRPRTDPLRPAETEFVTLLAQWLGAEIGRRRRFAELERYETILESVDDPVYALDADGRFSFLNDAARREFGDGRAVVGERPSAGQDDTGVEQIREQAASLLAADERSTTATFDLETGDGQRRVVESRLTAVDDEPRGTVGVLRDVTERAERERRLGSFQRAIEEAADGVAVLDDGEYTYVDQTHVDMYGLDEKAQLLGDSWRRLYDDAEVERLEAEAFPALEADGHWRGMVTGSRPDGSTFPAELSLTIVEGGRLVCTVRDDTERKARERELELKERAMDEATVGIQIVDPTREGTPLVYANSGFERMTGYGADEVLGCEPRFLQDDGTHPEQTARLREAIRAAEPVSLERRDRRKDGTPYWTRLTLTPVTDEGGSVRNYIAIQQDVTERRERSRWLQEFLGQGPLMFVETRQVDGEAVVASCNDRLLDRLGRDRSEVEGEPLAALYTAESAADLRAGGYEAALTGEFEMSERTLVDAEGEPVHTLLRAAPRPGDEYGTNALFVDISDRKERERQKDATVDALRRVYEVTTDSDLSFERKLDELLAAGQEYLGLPDAFLTRIETPDGDAPGTQTIVEARGTHDRLQPDESCPLPTSYCRKTIRRPSLTTITDAANDGWAGDPAYETFGLETYVAGSVDADGDTYGTLCFAAEEPRETAFTETERSFVDLLRGWVGYEIERRRAREELRQQRERLELTLSGTSTGITEWDLETDALRWNETLVELTGREIERFDEFERAVHPDDRDRVREALEETIRTGEPWVGEFRLVRDDGSVIWAGTRAVAVYDDDETPVRVLATGTDITERKTAERERRQNERRYRSLAENIPNGAVITFDADLEYELAAGELLSAFGLEEPDIAGEPVGTVVADADQQEELVPQFRAALDGDRTDRRIDLDGRTVRIHLVPIDPVDGDPTGARGLLLAQDVTDEARRERALYEERERFRLLTESVDEYAFLVVDEDGTVQTWNESAEQLFGYDAEAAAGLPLADLHRTSSQASGLTARLLQQARIAGESAHEGRLVRADGSTFYADVRYAPLESDDDEFRGYATIVRDMTEQRRQQRRTERFVEESDDVVLIVDTDGAITYASRSAERVLGHDPDDLVDDNLFDYVHPDGREDTMETFFASVESPDAGITAECRIRSGDGEWRNVEGRCRNMLDDDAIGGMLLYLRDVTDRKERVRRFESIFNGTFQFTGLLEPDGTVVEVNNAALELGGFDRDDVVGEPFTDTRWWTHSEAVQRDAREAVARAADGEFVRYETEMRGEDGLATIDFSTKPVTDDDGEVSLLVVEGRDITARQQYRRHQAVMRRVLRHNMRNDLSKVRGWAQLMRDEDDAERRAEQFETVARVLDRWESMTESVKEIRRVLDSQSEQGATAVAGTLIEDAVAPVREAHPDATVTTDVSGAGETTAPVSLADAVRELVENAAAASERATVAVELARREDGWIAVEVRDDGPGLPDVEAAVLETGEEKPLEHGQGLGLWMVRMAVTQAGGDVSVESTADGTTVRLRLPAGGPAALEKPTG
ncbi:MAG: PAS sensor histidine kinase [uncultured archaeon A07HB70]|nr:MAG: PAS sensor histidine kinase [uncultured archaeon A07HB70]